MTRILLYLVVGIATGVVLWSAWRLDRRVFAGLAVVAAAGLTVFVIASSHTGEDQWQLLTDTAVELKLREQHPTESGVRIAGTLVNHGQQPIGRVVGELERLECSDNGDCTVADQAPVNLRHEVAPDKSYPFTTMVRLSADPTAQHQWRLALKRVYGYQR